MHTPLSTLGLLVKRRKASQNVVEDVDHLNPEGVGREPQDVDGSEAHGAAYNGPSLGGPAQGRDDAQEGHLKNPQPKARENVGDEDGPHPVPA